MNSCIPEQLTFDDNGHTLHHCQVFSPDNEWIVYDTRNEDTQISTTTRIERLNIETKEIEILYEVSNPTLYGPGVGAATYSPIEDKVIFIHGLSNASKESPYGMSKRTGVAINTENSNKPIYMDARNIIAPFTKGALRGGTHSHCWNHDGTRISFTYNDFVLENNNLHDERVVGVMFHNPVEVPFEDDENFSGSHFSVIVSEIVQDADFGSDQIEKAFDECWLGNINNIAFQGWVRDCHGNRKTEIYVLELPEDLTLQKDIPLEGTTSLRPGVPKGVVQRRITFTDEGISNLRHWLRSSPNGDIIYFLKEDSIGSTQLFGVNLKNSKIKQYSFHNSSISSPFNISPNGDKAIYIQNHSLTIIDLSTSESIELYTNNQLYGIPNFDLTGNVIVFNQYALNRDNESFLQIFKVDLPNG